MVGNSGTELFNGRPWRWTQQGLVDLGTLPGFTFGDALATNADGSVVVGRAYGGGNGLRAWSWTASAGLVDLGEGSATAVTPDGAIVAGYTQSGCVWRWTMAGGLEIVDCVDQAEVVDIDASGDVLLGSYSDGAGRRAARWVTGLGRESLGLTGLAEATAMSADGATIVGTRISQLAIAFVRRERAAPSLGVSVCASLALPNSTGCRGRLCLGGPISRVRGTGQVQTVDAAGRMEVPLDLQAMPSPTGTFALQPGDHLAFTLWHRDTSPTASPTSNFTDAVRVRFE